MYRINPTDERNKNREKILIVDDENTIADLLKEIAAEEGFASESVSDGIECLEKFRDGGFYDVVLLDIHMPKLGGIETLKRLKRLYPDISIIIVTASKEFEYARLALKEGAYDYIVKPFNNSSVKALINRAVERSRLINDIRDYQENLERKVRTQANQLISLSADTLEAMILALDMRECETGRHSYRVTEYTIILAENFGVPNSDLGTIAKGALLHDIGKIGVPDHVLLKPEKLTDEEIEIMRKHPIDGYNLLKKFKFLEQAAEIVLSHHENFDGTGYPHKISGKAIPLGARIFSVVDTFDAMTTSRSYRQAISYEEAIDLIKRSSGRQFDPEIIEIFVSIPNEVWTQARTNIERAGSNYLKNLLFNLTNS
jgi:putative nucleotidyltransferase with HDIG domain